MIDFLLDQEFSRASISASILQSYEREVFFNEKYFKIMIDMIDKDPNPCHILTTWVDPKILS